MKIKAARDSVCMADDCLAPNERELDCDPEETLSEWLAAVTKYVPTMHNALWTVRSGDKILAYLKCDDKGGYTAELAVPDDKLSRLGIGEIYCGYHPGGSLSGKPLTHTKATGENYAGKN